MRNGTKVKIVTSRFADQIRQTGKIVKHDGQPPLHHSGPDSFVKVKTATGDVLWTWQKNLEELS